MLRVLEFAGMPVPENGLVVSPPFGGMLTVWQDGRYEFAAQLVGEAAEMQEPVSTFTAMWRKIFTARSSPDLLCSRERTTALLLCMISRPGPCPNSWMSTVPPKPSCTMGILIRRTILRMMCRMGTMSIR